MKRANPLTAITFGIAMSGLALVNAGSAIAETVTPGMGAATTAISAADASYYAASTDYGRGTTRSDNSPGNAGGLS